MPAAVSAFLRVEEIDARKFDGILGFTMGSWIHDGFLDSRWVPGFIHNWFWDEVKAARSMALNF